jgi:hypothetical protein
LNPHRTRNHGSIEHRDSIKRMLDKTKKDNRIKVLRGQLQKMAVDYSINWKTHGADMDAIRAFKSKQKYQSGANHESGSKFKYRSDGKSLFLHDYEVARHHKDGIEVSNAGYDSPLTYKTHQALGINSKGSEKHPKGLITLGTKEMDKNSGEWTLINHNDISEEPIIPKSMKKNQKSKADGTFVERKKPKRETSEQASFRERATKKELKEQGLDRGHPLSTVNIQKTDQRLINAITGLNTSLPTDKRGNEAHHLLEYSGDGGVGKKLEKNKDPRKAGNSKMIPKDYHKFISNFQKSSPATNLKRLRQMDSKIRQLKGKLQKIAAVGLPDNFGKDPEEYSSYSDFLDKFQKGENPDLKPSKYPLPKYFEEDYEAFHDKIQDSAFRFEDASDAGIDIENKENENQLQGNWGDLSETNKGSLRNHYQKQLSKELSWQKDPKLYTSGKLPESQQTYAQPGFNKNLVLDEVDPKEGYATINPNDIKPKFPKQYDDPSKYSKLKGRLQKMATDINRSPVNNTMSKSDEIINSFGNSGLSIEGVDGVYDTENHKILDANNSDDVERLRGLYGKDKYIGTNSETDTREGPNTNDLERTRKELQAIEDKGGVPALGFDSAEGGSLEALNVSVVNSKEEVLQALNKNQWGTGILHPNGKFEIVKSLKYIGRNK